MRLIEDLFDESGVAVVKKLFCRMPAVTTSVISHISLLPLSSPFDNRGTANTTQLTQQKMSKKNKTLLRIRDEICKPS